MSGIKVETYWNVNEIALGWRARKLKIKVETYWNVLWSSIFVTLQPDF